MVSGMAAAWAEIWTCWCCAGIRAGICAGAWTPCFSAAEPELDSKTGAVTGSTTGMSWTPFLDSVSTVFPQREA